MNENSLRSTSPVIVIAATVLILTCLLAIGVMTGIVPSPMSKDKAIVEAPAAAPAVANTTTTTTTTNRSQLTDNRPVARPAPSPVRERPRERTVEDRAPAPAPVVGNTQSVPAEGTVAGGSGPGRNVAAVCYNCGTVTSVRVVKEQGQAGLIGPIAGGALGGLAGSQIGGGTGKTIATIAGAAGGAVIGTEVERRQKSTSSYVVGVRLNDGTNQSFTFQSAPGYQEGDRVRVVDGRLVRDS